MLESDGMIVQSKTPRWTTLTIVNYGVYQDFADNSMDNSMDNSVDRSTDNSMDTNKKDKNVKNVNNNISANADVHKAANKVANKVANEVADKVVNKFNEICVSYPKVTKISDKRAQAIKNLMKDFSLEEIVNAFEKQRPLIS